MSGVPQSEVERDTGVYYDRLSLWTAFARAAGFGGGRERLTVHRALADPRAGGRPTVTRLHDLLFAALPPLAAGRVLDAGCGLGGTMIDLAARGRATFTGLTLSVRQARIARRAIAAAKLDTRVSALVQSYDTPPAKSFDAVLAIESLAHSSDPAASLGALARRVGPGGWLAIVDDLPLPSARGTADLALFQQGWRLPVLWDADQFLAACRRHNLAVVANSDLSHELRPRALASIGRLEALNRLLRRCAPSAAVSAMLDSYRGGLALERLYRAGRMRYGLIVARAEG